MKKELCDCLIEFSNAYVFIQIKEKDNSSTLTPKQWFDKKVVKNAKKQLRDTLDFLRIKITLFFQKAKIFVLTEARF